MAVYTRFPQSDLLSFLEQYDLGDFLELKEIEQGVENSNYFLTTSVGKFVLTLFEKRTDPRDLPFFLGLTDHLSKKSIPCPVPIRQNSGEVLGTLAGRPAVVISFLDGQMELDPNSKHCYQLGQMLAKMHLAVSDFPMQRKNTLSVDGWKELWRQCEKDAGPILDREPEWFAGVLARVADSWPKNLPDGIVHADLFTDNVFFQDQQLSGVIDFYFACHDYFAYDLAICLNAWCFPSNQFSLELSDSLLRGYQSIRELSSQEKQVWPILCQGASIRFLLTRLYDWINTPPDALVAKKDPNDYLKRLVFLSESNSFDKFVRNES